MPKIAFDLSYRHGIQHAIGGNPALASHLHAPVHVVELADRMGIRIDAEHAAEIEHRLVPAPVEIEPPRVGVDLNGNTMLGTWICSISAS